MRTPEVIAKDGFQYGAPRDAETDLAIASLRIALKAYFGTYQSFKHRLYIFDPSYSPPDAKTDAEKQNDIDRNHNQEYSENATEAIIHFQHFAELICKRILRRDHVILATDLSKKVDVLHAVLHRKKIDDSAASSLKSIEFSEALDRLSKLIKANKLKNASSFQFIEKHYAALHELNTLRNRVWHRGRYVLRYPALDQFIGGHILPFVRDVISNRHFMTTPDWLHTPLSCGISPAEEIIKEASKKQPSIGKIALLKELGRAAFENPIKHPHWLRRKRRKTKAGFKPNITLDQLFGSRHKRRAERIANVEAENDFADIEECCVCGVKSLVIYEESDIQQDVSDDGDLISVSGFRYTTTILCENCSFNLEAGGIENASSYGLKSIPDYFKSSSF